MMFGIDYQLVDLCCYIMLMFGDIVLMGILVNLRLM